MRNECNAAFQKAKREHNNTLCEELNEENPGSHNWWSKVKSMANMSSPKVTTIPDLTSGSMTATTYAEKAELLASHFGLELNVTEHLTKETVLDKTRIMGKKLVA